MSDGSRVTVDYTTLQCYDPVNQCQISRIRGQDLPMNPKFVEKCQGIPVKCCDLDLLNKLYVPENVKDTEVPLHIKKNDNSLYEICPLPVYKECLKEKQVGLCAAQKCNDLGYLEPDNYFQVCKALGNLNRKASEGNIPDCSDRTCDQVVNLKKTGAVTPETVNNLRSEIASQMMAQCQGYGDQMFKEKGYTLGNLFDFFPDDESFFIKGAVLICAIIIIIMLFNWWLGPIEQSGSGGVSDYMNGSSLFDEYMMDM